jgi:hypothetical protein
MSFGLLDRNSESAPGVIAPRVTLDFSNGGLGGALGGVVSGFTDTINPLSGAAKLEDGLISLRLVRGFLPTLDWAELHLAPVPGGPALPNLGDSGTITITAGDRSSSYKCNVDTVEHYSDGSARFGLGNGARVLAQARIDTALSDQTPARAIEALCAELDVATALDNAGDTMPRYVVDAGRSVLAHVAQLAASAGRLAYFNAQGKLAFLDDANGGEEIELRAGDAILDARLTERVGGSAPQITGAGATEWAWLRKDVTPNQSGNAANSGRRQTAPWLRTASGVRTLADAQSRLNARSSAPGRVLLAAYPDAIPGTIVALGGTQLDGPWRVMSSTISFDASGYLNELTLAQAEDGASALGIGGFL